MLPFVELVVELIVSCSFRLLSYYCLLLLLFYLSYLILLHQYVFYGC